MGQGSGRDATADACVDADEKDRSRNAGASIQRLTTNEPLLRESTARQAQMNTNWLAAGPRSATAATTLTSDLCPLIFSQIYKANSSGFARSGLKIGTVFLPSRPTHLS